MLWLPRQKCTVTQSMKKTINHNLLCLWIFLFSSGTKQKTFYGSKLYRQEKSCCFALKKSRCFAASFIPYQMFQRSELMGLRQILISLPPTSNHCEMIKPLSLLTVGTEKTIQNQGVLFIYTYKICKVHDFIRSTFRTSRLCCLKVRTQIPPSCWWKLCDES